MGWYQEFMGEQGDMPSKIYHICPEKDWTGRPNKFTYFSANFEKEQLVRCTHELGRLMETANCFYQKSSPPEVAWTCLEIDTMCLRMNGVESKMVPSDMDATLKCPHVYGGIPQEAVTRTFVVQRDPSTGEFLFVVGLTDACQKKPAQESKSPTSTTASSTLVNA